MVPVPAETVLVPLVAMPRSASRVNVAVVARVAVPITSRPGVGESGTAPRAVSSAIERMPALIVVVPVYVLAPDRTRVPVPVLASAPVPAMVPP